MKVAVTELVPTRRVGVTTNSGELSLFWNKATLMFSGTRLVPSITTKTVYKKPMPVERVTVILLTVGPVPPVTVNVGCTCALTPPLPVMVMVGLYVPTASASFGRIVKVIV